MSSEVTKREIWRCVDAGHDVGMRHEFGSLFSATCHTCDTTFSVDGQETNQ